MWEYKYRLHLYTDFFGKSEKDKNIDRRIKTEVNKEQTKSYQKFNKNFLRGKEK